MELAGAIPRVQDFLAGSALVHPDRTALVCGTARFSYAELERVSDALAHSLRTLGVRRGDRVMVFAENGPEVAIAFWGILKADAVVTIVNPSTKQAKLHWLLDDCRATVLIAQSSLSRTWSPAAAASSHLKAVVITGGPLPESGDRLPTIAAWDDAIRGDGRQGPPAARNLDIDLAAIVYTSGSTGDPKGVMLSHRNMLTAAGSIATYLGMTGDDVVLDVLPLAFDYGLYQMLLTFRVGGRLVLERSFAFPGAVLRRMVDEGVTGFPGVPTIFALLIGLKSIGDFDFSRVRFVTNTADALPARHLDAVRRIFRNARVFSMYGLTECKRCTYLPPEDLDRKPGSVGIAIPNTELWLVDERGERLGPGEVGELVIRGATVMQGYWEKPELTARKLRPGPLPGERVLYTGDLCRLDADGYLYFVGRMDDVIKSRGEKVAPREVENALADIPGVAQAAVKGIPDPVLGQAVKAFVVRAAGSTLTERDVIAGCRARLEPFMVPAEVAFVAELPTTATGKVRREDL